MMLTDLSLVDKDIEGTDIIDSLILTIDTYAKPFDPIIDIKMLYNNIEAILNDLDIKMFDTKMLYNRVDDVSIHLRLKDFEKSQGVDVINNNKKSTRDLF